MGRIRLALQDYLESRDQVRKRDEDINNFLWVVDFPLFQIGEESGQMESVHHPFTAPHPEDEQLLIENRDLFKIRSLAYDLVLNGQEIGGGSMRIHDAKLQKKVLEDILKVDYTHLQHLIDALECGAPPHGGFAIGIDRLMSIICKTASIRDVMAFPKGVDGKDHLSKAPVPISEEEKKMYHIEVVDTKV
jgi:aspartyl-tRNA synthetase